MPYKELVVGDPHVTVEDLTDAIQLAFLINQTLSTQHIDRLTILGDLFHNHSLLNVRVLDFWNTFLMVMRSQYPRLEIVLLVGNHDMPGDGTEGVHALVPFKNLEQIWVVDQPTQVGRDNKVYFPYFQNPNLFIQEAREWADKGCKTLICHQEFKDARYDNGYPSTVGVDASLVPFDQIISGHIHTPQRFGNVWYVGAPRWRTIHDAGVAERHLWILTYGDDGSLLDSASVGCSSYCRVIRREIVNEESPDLAFYPDKDIVHVLIEGTRAFIKEREAAIYKQRPNARVSTVATDEVVIRVRESDGIPVAYRKYVEAYVPKFGTDRSVLTKLAQERLYV